jgi:CNT family concentrative nucleoside transporter
MERGAGVLGIAVLLGIAWLFSVDRRAIRWSTVGVALGLQLAIAALILRTPIGAAFFVGANDLAVAFISYADRGIDFVFGRWPEQLLGPEGEPVRLPFVFAVRVLPIIIVMGSVRLPFVFAVRVLPIIIVMGSVFSVLYHVGLLPRLVDALARGLRRVLPISGAESLATIANVFLGMSEAPLLIRPYVERMTRSELFLVMTAGFATVAGSVLIAYIGMLGSEYAGHLIGASFMSAPAAVAAAKILVPETGTPETVAGAHIAVERPAANVIDAAAVGASDGLRLALNVGAMLIAFVAIVYMLDDALGWAGGLVGWPEASFEGLLGIALAPIALLLGVAPGDAFAVGEMLGVKTVLNEFLAYEMLARALDELEPRSAIIASYALCGFANFGSLAILLGALGGIAPGRRGDIARDGLRAILAGSIASFMTGAIAGLLL